MSATGAGPAPAPATAPTTQVPAPARFEPSEPAGSAGPAVALTDAAKRFGGGWIIRHLDLAIPRGSVVGLIGPSGCGKTTTIRLATGVYRPDEGEVRLLGRVASEMGNADRLDIGYLPQEPVLFEELSLWQNLNFHASLNGVRFRRRRRLRALMELVGLRGDERKLVRHASGGMKRRLALAATLAHDPPVLMLDEPTAGIDPVLRRRFWEHFRQLRDEGHTLIVATQYVGEAADCDQVVLLNAGRIVALGAPEALRRQAVGGDLVELETAEPPSSSTFDLLSRFHPVHRVDLIGPRRVRVTVDDARSNLPQLLELLRGAGAEVTGSAEVPVNYDEVFVALVERDRLAHEGDADGDIDSGTAATAATVEPARAEAR